MKHTNHLICIGIFVSLLSSSFATLTNSYTFVGEGNWSIDATGSNSTPTGTISAVVPVGSTIEQAFLYSSTWGTVPAPSVNFDGSIISGASWTALGLNPDSSSGLQAFRADVTTQVAATIGGGSASPYAFNILSETPTNSTDGEVLAIIYSNPAEATRTISFLDGFARSSGDTTTINLAEALTGPQLADPNFQAMMSLGIGFGYQGSTQDSHVDVNGSALTSSAGGQDDGGSYNGGLITVGGIGDDFTTNPANPNAGANGNPRQDDEAYNLLPFLTTGDTSITIDTYNTSRDDNIFFAAINITAVAGVNEPPPDVEPPTNDVPDNGSTWLLLAPVMLMLARMRARMSKKTS